MPRKRENVKKAMRRHRKVNALRRFDNSDLVPLLGEFGEEGIVVRIVGIDYEADNPKSTGRWIAWLSASAVDWETYTKMIVEKFELPYAVEKGYCYIIRKASDQEVKEYKEKRKQFRAKMQADLDKHKDEVQRLRKKHLEQVKQAEE